MSDLPESFSPVPEESESLHTEEMYAIGKVQLLRDGSTSVGMTDGPYPDVNKMLKVWPSDSGLRTSYIIKFCLDGTDEFLYKWCEKEQQWQLNNLGV